jgi:hypothetical protein
MGCFVFDERGALLDEGGEVAEFAKLHHKVHLGLGFETVEEGDDVGMMQFSEDLDFFIEIGFELVTELRDVDGFDGDERASGLVGLIRLADAVYKITISLRQLTMLRCKYSKQGGSLTLCSPR